MLLTFRLTVFIATAMVFTLTPFVVSAKQVEPLTTAPLETKTAEPDDESTIADESAATDKSVISKESPPLIIVANRPRFSETLGFVPPGHLQLENGYTYTFRNRNGVEAQENNVPEILARLGVLNDRLELRMITSGYFWERTKHGSGAAVSSQGFSDVALGFKVKLNNQAGWIPRLAFDASSTLGVGTPHISSQIAVPIVKLLWSYNLSNKVSLAGNLNLAFPTTKGERFTQGQASVFLTYLPTVRTLTFVEYFVFTPYVKGTDAAHYIDFGGAFLATNRIQLDARMRIGVNQEADNLSAGVGISFLL